MLQLIYYLICYVITGIFEANLLDIQIAIPYEAILHMQKEAVWGTFTTFMNYKVFLG